ncbi:MAG TPA: hypothetical protein VFA90_20225 [Terriglobales bacterium]|nr:hypothetical protein [Terriglobales bacterium]
MGIAVQLVSSGQARAKDYCVSAGVSVINEHTYGIPTSRNNGEKWGTEKWGTL